MPTRIDRAWNDYSEQFRKRILPKLLSAEIVITIVEGDKPSIQAATEIGYCLLTGKPLLVIQLPGETVPPGLMRAADMLVTADPSTPQGQDTIAAAMRALGLGLGWVDLDSDHQDDPR